MSDLNLRHLAIAAFFILETLAADIFCARVPCYIDCSALRRGRLARLARVAEIQT